jgi:Lon protease-like protein
MEAVIRIFPLNIVIFPFSKIPLHIFEERYKKLINYCLDKKTGFGIVAQIKEELSKIGCYVEVTDVLQKYPAGEMDIIVAGKSRFLIKETTVHPDGYQMATIEEYNDLPVDINNSLLERLRSAFEGIINKVNFKLEDAFWEGYNKTEMKSFKIAEKSGLSIEQQQELLTIRNENNRIDFLLKHFKSLGKQLTENATLKALVMNNGYLNIKESK